MGKNTGISWCDHTFNPWWGCTKVSDGCKFCYAETQANRFHSGLWGPGSTRRQFSTAHWNEPILWNRSAVQRGVRELVFGDSMCDVFEDRADLINYRLGLWDLTKITPNLIWLFLTKHPENITRMVPVQWLMWGFPSTVWMGTSVEDPRYLKRLVFLQDIPCHKFVSVEPMIGPVEFSPFQFRVEWVICGGESGAGHRPMNKEWAIHLHQNCQLDNVPFFFKQMGGHPNKQDDPTQWPEELRVQEFPAGIR